MRNITSVPHLFVIKLKFLFLTCRTTFFGYSLKYSASSFVCLRLSNVVTPQNQIYIFLFET